MSLLNVCFNTKIQRNYLWNQQKTQSHSSLRLNIEIFKNKIDNPLRKYSKLHRKNRHKLIENWFFNEID